MPALTATEHAPINPALDLKAEIRRLKAEMDAVILAHYYQESEIQDLADSVGDSLQLAQYAEKTDAQVIVFAGVHFMAETAKILNPDKLVLMPDADAGCSLADSCPPEAFAKFKAEHPGHYVVSYVNCSAAIKAMSDVIVTSSNAEKIVSQIPKNQPIIFAPDKNLGAYISKKLGRDMVLWNGSCIVHEIFSEARIVMLKSRHPNALVLAHPECEALVLRHADFIGSTAAIRKFARESDANEFIIATEPGIIYPMQKDCPDKTFIPAPPNNSCECNVCPHMRRNTVEKLYLCMRDKRPALQMDEKLRLAALAPIRRMLGRSGL